MEVRFENGWNGQNWMADRMNAWLRESQRCTPRHWAPRADVTEDHDAYHFHRRDAGHEERLDRSARGRRQLW